MEKTQSLDKQPRRKFFTRLLSGIAGAAVLLSARRRATGETKNTDTPNTDPILYHRNEESERYYRT
ncbi:MAG: hypothetical protein ACREQK_10895, partial [Candidatus Binatia bacterium]